MTTSNGLPARGPGETLGDQPKLAPRTGGVPPFVRPEKEEFPGVEAESTIRAPDIRATPGVAPVSLLGAPAPVEPGGAPPLPDFNVPKTFEEMLFQSTLLDSFREVSIVVEQTIVPSGTGSVTVLIPANFVDISRDFREAGDGSVTYRIEVDGVGRTAVADHRILGSPNRKFARHWEKYTSILITFTNNDAVNSAILQVEWISHQIDTTKWLAYRDVLRAWARLLGVQE